MVSEKDGDVGGGGRDTKDHKKSDVESSNVNTALRKPDSDLKAKGFDDVFDLVGGSSFFQWLLFATVSIQGAVLVNHHIGFVYLGAVPKHWCKVDNLPASWSLDQIRNISIPQKTAETNASSPEYESCTMYNLSYSDLSTYGTFDDAYASIDFSTVETMTCNKWDYDRSLWESTVVTQFDLVCDRRNLVASIQASYMGGVVVGSLLLGSLSDKLLGRRNAILFACLLIMVGGFAAAYAESFIAFSIFRFVVAVGVSGSFQNCFVLLLEYSDKSYRSLLGIIQQMPFAIGYMAIALYGYYFRRWDHLQLAFAVTSSALIAYLWILPESARWLASRERDAEAIKRLHFVARINKRPLPSEEELLPILKTCREEKELEDSLGFWGSIWKNLCVTLENYLHLIRTPELRKRSFVIWTLFSIVALVYYGVVFDSASLTSDPFLMVFLGGLMEVPAYLLSEPFVSRWGRRPTLISLFVLTGIAFLAFCATPPEFQGIRIFFSMSGKLFVSSAFAVIYLLGAELYPTSARITGLGTAVLMGRIGSIIAPYVVDRLAPIYRDLPTIIFGVTALFAAFIGIFLPETKDSEMKDLVHAVEADAQRVQLDIPFIRRTSKAVLDVPLTINPQTNK